MMYWELVFCCFFNGIWLYCQGKVLDEEQELSTQSDSSPHRIHIPGSLGSHFAGKPKWKAILSQWDEEHDLPDTDMLQLPVSGILHATQVGNMPMFVQVVLTVASQSLYWPFYFILFFWKGRKTPKSSRCMPKVKSKSNVWSSTSVNWPQRTNSKVQPGRVRHQRMQRHPSGPCFHLAVLQSERTISSSYSSCSWIIQAKLAPHFLFSGNPWLHLSSGRLFLAVNMVCQQYVHGGPLQDELREGWTVSYFTSE